MAKCPFATWKPITGGVGAYSGGPFKIVHHTTEGSTASGAMGAYKANKSDPHFTVDPITIYQHIDTSVSARSLANPPGGVQTNRDSAIQIEVVGFAGKPKNSATLKNVAKLCRWIEQTHSVPQKWPNGFPKVGTRDPGGHNRNANNWDKTGGHYGHSQVPENTHWDPGYTRSEVEIIMGGSLEFVGSPEALGSGETEVTLNSSISQVEMEITPHLNLITYSISFSLDEKGHATIPLDIAWERVVSLIPQAIKNEEGNWQSCIASLAEEEGQTILVATAGTSNAAATVMVKVLDDTQIFEEESLGCP
ncbi:N-acetylmuramoyl-L-alanine amidase [Geminocystis sp. NIES-3709]|uniref:peptidoglycan recognition protein family protein n=1 Tax=Geminocystis sp. NIES-3709 TaxID=1617448 RepID=UPI0005FC498A|nr:N-acetylmuramoyl-L-alanine amidase [Geminocystis sp. NIES-3709]BAQ67151.1 phage protein [Geminocystis sp. NIES-3709]